MAAAAVSTPERVLLILLMFFPGLLRLSSGFTNPQDASALFALVNIWTNAPPSWKSNDPCGSPWEGVFCTNSRVTTLKLTSMGIKGQLSGDIGQLTELQFIDLSYNSELGGTLPLNIVNLKHLIRMSLQSCSFRGRIPELGTLTNLTYLALNSNEFTGGIPASLGFLSNLYWIDLADNQLTGSLPISNSTSGAPGLDMLVNAKHFHFNKNQLSGQIPEELFSSKMILIHLLFDHNQFNGTIPESIGLVTSLEIIRLDQNFLTGPVPTNISALTGLLELHLADNQLTGTLPDLNGFNNLNYLDLSNNSFSPSEAPSWFSTLETLSVLVIESGGLIGQVPNDLFASPQLEQVNLANNKLNGTLDMSNISTGSLLQLVDFENNDIDNVVQTPSYTKSLVLVGNPVCSGNSNANYCKLQTHPLAPYSTSLASCGQTSCPSEQNLNPGNCACAYPYEGIVFLRAPLFADVTNSTPFIRLETSLAKNLSLTPGSVYISAVSWNADSYMQLQLALFPSSGIYFNRSEINRIGYDFSNQVVKMPQEFGPYYFSAFQYHFQGASSTSGLSIGVIAGIVVGCGLLAAALVGVGIYALLQQRKAKRAIEQTQPFASWGAGDKDAGSAPVLKGARWFSFLEIKKCTNNFSENNELGAGGYGKVYKGIFSDGQVVAIKKAQQGSMQGALEFKTEIELLSRLHHKNLVELVGFCYERGEQMLVYEYIPNGTLRENLLGRGGIQLDWRRRLMIALDSARGLAYLHELANPPIIHRDVKSANILLDEYLTAKVADFGLSKLVSDSEKTHVSTQVKGTLGYLDPEYYMTQQLSDKSDVYSFGVVMLELISGKLPIEKGKYIVREVRAAINEDDAVYYGIENIMDTVLLNSSSSLIGFRRFVDLAMNCVDDLAAGRPSMNEVVKEIETILLSHGMKINSSASYAGNTKTHDPLHPYVHSSEEYSETSTGAFEYSGGYSFQKTIEPK